MLTRRVLDEVGSLTALTFRATIDDPGRFGRSRDVGAHLGLTPRRYRSGKIDVQGRISRCGNESACTALYEAVHSLLIRSTKWSVLKVMGLGDCQTARHGADSCGGRAEAGDHPASDVERRHRLPLEQGGRRLAP